LKTRKTGPSRFRYSYWAMKSHVAVSLLLAALLVPALAQNQPATENADPLFFVKTAAQVAENVQHESLQGFLGLYVSEKNWDSGLRDGDLGAFLKVKEAKPGRSVACVFSGAKDAATCVYFDGKTPFGEVSAKAGAQGGLQAVDLAAAYKPISKEMLKKGDQEWHFSEGGVNTDDGTPLPGFGITK
jgi:hypothetical protein